MNSTLAILTSAKDILLAFTVFWLYYNIPWAFPVLGPSPTGLESPIGWWAIALTQQATLVPEKSTVVTLGRLLLKILLSKKYDTNRKQDLQTLYL